MKEELKKAFAKAEECLEDAKFLFEGERYTAAVNLAYYSMFTAVQALLLDKDIFVKTHSGAKTKFHEHFLKTKLLPVGLGKTLENASVLRQGADYDFEEISKEDAQQTVNEASEFLKGLKAFAEKDLR